MNSTELSVWQREGRDGGIPEGWLMDIVLYATGGDIFSREVGTLKLVCKRWKRVFEAEYSLLEFGKFERLGLGLRSVGFRWEEDGFMCAFDGVHNMVSAPREAVKKYFLGRDLEAQPVLIPKMRFAGDRLWKTNGGRLKQIEPIRQNGEEFRAFCRNMLVGGLMQVVLWGSYYHFNSYFESNRHLLSWPLLGLVGAYCGKMTLSLTLSMGASWVTTFVLQSRDNFASVAPFYLFAAEVSMLESIGRTLMVAFYENFWLATGYISTLFMGVMVGAVVSNLR